MSVLEYSEDLARWIPKARHRHKCHFCKCLTTSFFSAVNHAKRHQMGLQPFDCQTNSVEKYFCRTCNYTTDVTTEFNHHISEFHGKPQSDVGSDKVSHSNLCEKCGFQSYSIVSWSRHDCVGLTVSSERDQNDISKSQIPEETRWYTCDKCEFKSGEERDLQRHQLEHIKWYKCGQCDYKTDKTFTLRHHKLQHVVPYYKCEKCPYIVKQKSLLEKHIPECDKLKLSANCMFPKFKCLRCPYLVRQRWQLEKHIKTAHLLDNAFWYKCGKCDFRTQDLIDIKFHDRQNHSPTSKWFKCDRCKCSTSREVFLVEWKSEGVGLRAKYRTCERCSYASPVYNVKSTKKDVSGKPGRKYLDTRGIHLIDHNYCRRECA